MVAGSIKKQVRSFGCRCLGPRKKGVVFLGVVVVGPIQQQKCVFLAVVVLVQLKNKKTVFWVVVVVGPLEKHRIMYVWLSRFRPN